MRKLITKYDSECIKCGAADRLAMASRILAGLLANPAIVGYNHNCGWTLINCTDAAIAGYALKLADELILANNIKGGNDDRI